LSFSVFRSFPDGLGMPLFVSDDPDLSYLVGFSDWSGREIMASKIFISGLSAVFTIICW
jgi:hypothetical protein